MELDADWSQASAGECSRLKPQSAAAAIAHNFKTDRATVIFREDTILPEPWPQLAAEIRTHDGNVVFGEAAQQLLLKIIDAHRRRSAVALLKRSATLLDIFF